MEVKIALRRMCGLPVYQSPDKDLFHLMGCFVGQSKQRKERFFRDNPKCIFCGGASVATTEEHCPPRALFKDRQWPEGLVFAACESCNGESSDDDLMVAFLAHLDPANKEATHLSRSFGLMKNVNRQFPTALKQMFEVSNVQARIAARRLGLKPSRGQLYRNIGIVNVPEAMPQSVSALAAKLTKAIYYQQTGEVFPLDGGIMFQWFSNAQRLEFGEVPVLRAMSVLAGVSPPIQRSGKDLKNQFEYLYTRVTDCDLHVVQAFFGRVFGFVTVFSQNLGQLEEFNDRISKQCGSGDGGFQWLSTNRYL